MHSRKGLRLGLHLHPEQEGPGYVESFRRWSEWLDGSSASLQRELGGLRFPILLHCFIGIACRLGDMAPARRFLQEHAPKLRDEAQRAAASTLEKLQHAAQLQEHEGARRYLVHRTTVFCSPEARESVTRWWEGEMVGEERALRWRDAAHASPPRGAGVGGAGRLPHRLAAPSPPASPHEALRRLRRRLRPSFARLALAARRDGPGPGGRGGGGGGGTQRGRRSLPPRSFLLGRRDDGAVAAAATRVAAAAFGLPDHPGLVSHLSLLHRRLAPRRWAGQRP